MTQICQQQDCFNISETILMSFVCIRKSLKTDKKGETAGSGYFNKPTSTSYLIGS